MVSSIDIALSGLNAAGRRLEVSANNLANQFSTKSIVNGQQTDSPYQPQKVDQISLSTGGVITQVNNATPATVTVPDLQGAGATTEAPAVDQATEIVQQLMASYDFKANLKTIKVQDDLFKSLLDIKA